MKRFHVHVGVDDLSQSIGFYSNLFGTEPAGRPKAGSEATDYGEDEPGATPAIRSSAACCG